MRWLTVAGVLLYLTRYNDAGALKCHPGRQDPLCALEKKEISPIQNLIERETSEAQCLPGSEWESNCHRCHCSEAGFAKCTKLDSCSSSERAEPLHCKPNTTFKSNGKTCNCLEDGSVLCTSLQPHRMEKRSPEEKCTPGTTFNIECNTCWCLSDGRVGCTKKGCINWQSKQKREIPEAIPVNVTKSNSTRVVCVANRMFIKDCNTCWCNEDGTSYFCTRRVCIETPDDVQNPEEELKLRVVKKECKPFDIFELDCNMCRCNPDGKSYSCTRRACVDVDEKNATSRSARALQEPESKPKACQPGQEFRMDCNKCLCNDEGQDFSCTRIDCAALNNNGGADTFVARRKRDTTARVEVDCVPGSVFDRDCNVCRCTTDGKHASCTLKRCQKDNDVTTEPSPAFRCTPGDQFRRDCNDCTCSADGKNVFCTLRLCDEEITP